MSRSQKKGKITFSLASEPRHRAMAKKLLSRHVRRVNRHLMRTQDSPAFVLLRHVGKWSYYFEYLDNAARCYTGLAWQELNPRDLYWDYRK
jgi:hypothetical protein